MNEEKLKYLDFLQSAISRMASNSFLIKGWSVALGTAVLGFSVKESNSFLALIAAIPAAFFWALDAYYLALETSFRILWNKAIADEGTSLNMQPASLGHSDWWKAVWNRSVWLLHGPMIFISALAAFVLWRAQARC